jgi:hexosaminidase
MKYVIKKLSAGLAILVLTSIIFAANASSLALIPWPQQVQPMGGSFTLTPQTRIYADWSSRQTAQCVAQRLRQSTGYPLQVHWKPFGSIPQNSILLATKNANTNLGPEGYMLFVRTNSIVISAPTQAGLFYGGQTLLQLLPPQIFATNAVSGVPWQAPCVQIADWPRFPWRGLMLDVSRHFFNKAEVESVLDEMALYKLNRFHWHLVDDQGWRIEIKKYPKLTQIGAWRTNCVVQSHDVEPMGPAWASPTPDKFNGPKGRYGGFYTQKDIREIVAFAIARHITIVPEIEMPGHSEAALTAYPQFSCFGGPYTTDSDLSIHDGIYDPSNPQTFQFLDNILTEVFQLFPGQYIHIGGDEVRTNYWSNSAACRAFMRREGLNSQDELQSYFIKRMEKFINSRGKTLIGWSEILKGGLATNAVVMDWIGGGKQAAEAGHDAIMTPIEYYYFDHFHSPKAVDNYTPMDKVYSSDPIPAGLSPLLQSHILGAEAVLWTEYIASLPHAQYMLFPRTCALSEVMWSSRSSRDWTGFQQRLKTDEVRLDERGVNYRPDNAPPIVGFPPCANN